MTGSTFHMCTHGCFKTFKVLLEDICVTCSAVALTVRIVCERADVKGWARSQGEKNRGFAAPQSFLTACVCCWQILKKIAKKTGRQFTKNHIL